MAGSINYGKMYIKYAKLLWVLTAVFWHMGGYGAVIGYGGCWFCV